MQCSDSRGYETGDVTGQPFEWAGGEVVLQAYGPTADQTTKASPITTTIKLRPTAARRFLSATNAESQ